MLRNSSKDLSEIPLDSGPCFSHLGDRLKAQFSHASSEVVIVAPFIKVDALKRLLEQVSGRVKIDIFTRWRLNELAIGVSDIDIWGFVDTRAATRLFLVNDLHAKYFRCDQIVIIGSANVTATALGWSLAPNLELLISTSVDESSSKFEEALSATSIEVTQSIYIDFLSKLSEMDPVPVSFSPDASPVLLNFDLWAPAIRDPSDLWLAYKGRNDLVAKRDLPEIESILSLADLSGPRLSHQTEFRKFLGDPVLSLPFFSAIRNSFDASLRFQQGADLMARLLNLPREEAKAQWQVAIRWLIYFAPEQYEVSRNSYSETLIKRA